MRKWWLLPMLLLLSGCTATAWETVNDSVPVAAVSTWQTHAYALQIGLPENVQILEQQDGRKLYAGENGEPEIETRTFLTSDYRSAVRAVSGFEAEQLTVLQTDRFGLPEYRFGWVSQTEQGTRVYSAMLVLDGMECYAVICSRPEVAGDSYDKQIRQVFSSFGLFTDEGV